MNAVVMKAIVRLACVGAALGVGLYAQAPPAPERLSAWPYYKEIPNHNGGANFVLDRDVLDRARPDAADLRLYDANNREIPYALTVRRDVDTHSLFTSREFNRSVEGETSVVSCDLGAEPQEHNEAVIVTAGENFRRLAQVEGSPDGSQWSTLASQAILFRFTSGGRTVEQHSVTYPVSRFRYLRVRVEHDPQTDHAAPQIVSLAVSRSVRAVGETVPFPLTLEGRDPDPFQGRPASIWRLDLGGRIPLQSLEIQVGDRAFSRPFQLEIVDNPSAPQLLASGDLARDEEHAASEVRIDFTEQFARRLKLTVIDDRNPPLGISGVTALSAAREVTFDAPGTLRLYYGNPKAIAPNYYVARTRAEQPNRLPLGPQQANPVYRPEAKPLSERSPWLVYLVLVGACAALGVILLNLARKSAELSAHPLV
jgi:hypothetical protein